MSRRVVRSLPAQPLSSLRLGLCCQFAEHPVRFRTTTATSLLKLERPARLHKLSELCRANAASLLAALTFCHEHGIGCFRVSSKIWPLKTHPDVGYEIADLPEAEEIAAAFRRCGAFAVCHGLRVCFHPDQFVVLNSPREDVVRKSLAELEYQAEVAAWIGADVINIHAGGGYGDKVAALATFERSLDRLSDAVRTRLTLENDDTVYTPADLLPICHAAGLPLVYDVHHHRCLRDAMTVEEATAAAFATWAREPLFHISSPIEGWQGAWPRRHHDYIDLADFPDAWRQLPMTIEVEAKAKELAVLRLRKELTGSPARASGPSSGRAAKR